MDTKNGFYIDSVIDDDISVRAFANDINKDTALFMRLMNEANGYGDSSRINEVISEQPAETAALITSNVKKYGDNYAKIICRVDEAVKARDNKSGSMQDKVDKWFFSNILFFTSEPDKEKNSTLKNLIDAVRHKNINVVVFTADSVTYKATDKYIDINDGKTSYRIQEQSNADTICIARLGAQDNNQCEHCLKEIQEWGIFTINPIKQAKTASDKYETAVLLDKYSVAQPKFALLVKADIKDGINSLAEKLDVIYPGTKDKILSDSAYDKNTANSLEYVVKVLDGHGGTGVFMLDGKSILAVLQAIFEIDPERELLLQKKEDGDGDIRVHVLSSNSTQVILGAMKRKKIKSDFRSNVSLGAEPAVVKLTKEQEELAKQVAKISGMPWCAVDIMPVKGEEYDNVVLEYNASPGTDGISEVLGDNFMSVLLNAVNEIRDELPLSVKQIGYTEDVLFTFEDGETPVKIDAKFDTGNGALAPTLGCDDIVIDGETAKITIMKNTYVYKINREINPKVGQSRENRVTVTIPEITIGTRKLKDVEFAIVTTRSDKSTRALINRDVMRRLGFVINPNLKNSLDY